ncbi:hypothetical protein PSTEL_02040 [Paenibacillus stellifer]|uniref:Uncharacterized protein n=1 Tax=Paenibacillus stellifer TaxID=169760 RepID=A0A089N079_9BACL|nr:hypothetical protein [Paenibacillus stellifer]AIQ62084.1 hypothetical protein PSTEL_02040 [Paenibacillus stellifer]
MASEYEIIIPKLVKHPKSWQQPGLRVLPLSTAAGLSAPFSGACARAESPPDLLQPEQSYSG